MLVMNDNTGGVGREGGAVGAEAVVIAVVSGSGWGAR